jgi:hypothetical protein
MVEVIEKLAKEFAAAVLDIIEWAWTNLRAPQG